MATQNAFGDLDQVVLAYATTTHKSQVSEYPAVVIPVTTQHYMMLKRNLLYTGVTRPANSAPNHLTPCCGKIRGVWLNASAPPASMRSETPSRM